MLTTAIRLSGNETSASIPRMLSRRIARTVSSLPTSRNVWPPIELANITHILRRSRAAFVLQQNRHDRAILPSLFETRPHTRAATAGTLWRVTPLAVPVVGIEATTVGVCGLFFWKWTGTLSSQEVLECRLSCVLRATGDWRLATGDWQRRSDAPLHPPLDEWFLMRPFWGVFRL